MLGNYYILQDKKIIAIDDVIKWASWFKEFDKQIAQDIIGGVRISTIFLGSHVGLKNERPLLFETMIFGGEFDQEIRRYCTYEQAEQGHLEMVSMVLQVQKIIPE